MYDAGGRQRIEDKKVTYRIANDYVQATELLDRFLNHLLAVREYSAVALNHSRLDAMLLLDLLG